jgi:DNA polymerase-3 subunit alpha
MTASERPRFVHLRMRSAYSLLEGALHVGDIAKLAKAHRMPAAALTDADNLFGALEFSEYLAGAGVQPIIGCALTLRFSPDDAPAPAGTPEDLQTPASLGGTAGLGPSAGRTPEDATGPGHGKPAPAREGASRAGSAKVGAVRNAAARNGVSGEGSAKPLFGPLVLLAANAAGYANLMALSSAAFLDAPSDTPAHVGLDLVSARTEGLIALTGGPAGVLNQLLVADRVSEAERFLDRLQAAFGDRLYIELQRHGLPDEAKAEPHLVRLAYARDLPLVAANEPYFDARATHAAHEALLCIADGAVLGQAGRRRVTPEHYFKSAEEMAALFADLPEAIDNTIAIARRCNFRPQTARPMLPRFETADGRSEMEEMRVQAESGLARRLAEVEPAAPEEVYRKRLEHELAVIEKMGFAGYFLIVSDFIKWAKSNDIPVGPGRGSGAGSLIAWVLFITDLDPLRFGLLFERFLNPERISMPDFDVDFCQDRRGEVIDYVRTKYGADRVAQIITFGTLQARAVVRDVGRVMQLPFGQVDKIAKLVPSNPANPVSLQDAIEIEPKLKEMRDAEPEVAALLETALQLEGLYRNASTHAAGVVIGNRPLSEIVPLYRDPRSDIPATQFNMKWVEPAGLVKFDFLGLKTLTVIDRAVKFIAQKGVVVDWTRIPLDDRDSYRLLGTGATLGVFQLESQGMRDTLRKLKPDRIEDVIALISLYRPGPMKNIDTYVDAKFGRREPDYLHASLRPVLEETYGVIIYQEQVMQIAQILSGYSLGEADLLRRAMGKKKPEEMAKQKERFVSGAKERGVEPQLADRIFELVAEFAGYGFNKSHAAAYAIVAFQTAWLKAHHPVEFFAASMSLDISDPEKLAAFRQEARRFGVEVLPPSINASRADFDVDGSAVLYALGAVRNVGVAAMRAIENERETSGPFADLYDFAKRVDPKMINKRLLENLVRAGAFDTLEPNRARLAAGLEQLMGWAQRAAEERMSSQGNLFARDTAAAHPPELPRIAPWPEHERLTNEFQALGLYLSGHPLDDWTEELAHSRVAYYAHAAQMAGEDGGYFRMAGVIRAKTERLARSGGRFAYITLSDPTGEYEAMVMPETLTRQRDLLAVGALVLLRARARRVEGDLKFIAEDFSALDAGAGPQVDGLIITLREGAPVEDIAGALTALRDAHNGAKGRVKLVLRLKDGRAVEVDAGAALPVSPQARAAIKAFAGVEDVAPWRPADLARTG